MQSNADFGLKYVLSPFIMAYNEKVFLAACHISFVDANG
jgi:hypothetical protein